MAVAPTPHPRRIGVTVRNGVPVFNSGGHQLVIMGDRYLLVPRGAAVQDAATEEGTIDAPDLGAMLERLRGMP